jgi:hypothetical protein
MWINLVISLWLGLSASATCLAMPANSGNVTEFVCYFELNNGQRFGAAGKFAPLGKDELMPGPSPQFEGKEPPASEGEQL